MKKVLLGAIIATYHLSLFNAYATDYSKSSNENELFNSFKFASNGSCRNQDDQGDKKLPKTQPTNYAQAFEKGRIEINNKMYGIQFNDSLYDKLNTNPTSQLINAVEEALREISKKSPGAKISGYKLSIKQEKISFSPYLGLNAVH